MDTQGTVSPLSGSREQEFQPDSTANPRGTYNPLVRSELGLSPEGGPADTHSGHGGGTMNQTAKECADVLQQGFDLVEALADEQYAFDVFEGGSSIWSSPGAHTRHVLDFLDCLLTGLDAKRIDYTNRKRRLNVEQSRTVGLREIERAIASLERLTHLEAQLPLDVRSDMNQEWSKSTLSRELQFVIGHVIHHYALIRLTLAHRGIEAPSDYGVAPSTLAIA
jgi:hypothetical protein